MAFSARLAGFVHIPIFIWSLLIIPILSTHLGQIAFVHRHFQLVPVRSQASSSGVALLSCLISLALRALSASAGTPLHFKSWKFCGSSRAKSVYSSLFSAKRWEIRSMMVSRMTLCTCTSYLLSASDMVVSSHLFCLLWSPVWQRMFHLCLSHTRLILHWPIAQMRLLLSLPP